MHSAPGCPEAMGGGTGPNARCGNSEAETRPGAGSSSGIRWTASNRTATRRVSPETSSCRTTRATAGSGPAPSRTSSSCEGISMKCSRAPIGGA